MRGFKFFATAFEDDMMVLVEGQSVESYDL